MKKSFMNAVSILLVLISVIMIPLYAIKVNAAEFADNIKAKSAILIEASTGKVLFEQNADVPYPPASVTKIMTLLLVMEALDSEKISKNDMVSVSEHAASMGGSQVYLEPGEQMSVDDMIKCVVVSSANDAAVALAEHIGGSEESFVHMMNERARELGMNNSTFKNTNGLDDSETEHLTSARDIAIMSRELLSHPKILDYTCIWQDVIRNGSFTLSNTNRLIRYYEGANGLKTGSTSKAGFCISATAKRSDMQLICVIMGAENRDVRNAEAKKLLDFGFANYSLYTYPAAEIGSVKVTGGTDNETTLISDPFSIVVDKGKLSKIEKETIVKDYVSAPTMSGESVGKIVFKLDGNEIGYSEVRIAAKIEKISFSELFKRIIVKFSSII